MKNRSDYVKCILAADGEQNSGNPQTLCGRTPTSFEFLFQDAGHAANHAASGGRLMICPECSQKLVEIIQSNTYPDEP